MIIQISDKLKLGIALLSMLLISAIIFEAADAATYAGGRKGNAKPNVFYSASVSNFGYTSNFDAGRAYWNTNSKVNITKTTSLDNRPDIYYVGNTSNVNVLGVAAGYSSTSTLVALTSYWDFATATIYDNSMRAQSNYTTSRINYNAAHEIGHTIKMAHVGIPTNSVMVQGWYNIPTSITSFDSGEVNTKW